MNLIDYINCLEKDEPRVAALNVIIKIVGE